MTKYLLSALLLVCLGCNEIKPKPSAIDQLSKSVHELDSSMDASLKRSNEQVDRMNDYLLKYKRCRDLDDSAKNIYILYAQDQATYRQYERAHALYVKYFHTVYQPALAGLSPAAKKKEGGK